MGSLDKACISGFLCRLCSEMHRIVIHIYGDQGQRLCLVEKINGYLPITISPTDPLPKTICTTCLRRVEQHYDLLMRLSRIQEKRIVGVDKYRHRILDLSELSEVSSPELSEDDLYLSDDSSRRRRSPRSQSTHQPPLVESQTSSTSAVNTCDHLNSSNVAGTGGSASTSASALNSISENVDHNEGASPPSNINSSQTIGNSGENLGVNMPQHID